ncbi:hypothetical protein F5B22DRAFT_50830 [Xylaria bambusicola]|uniref:uncharacterized protein n=1 Tax=Xylaria bambusicola TaxID=326684 RepID=UPI0020071F78|nr:uncharacterized protein F5B22DRAFT_50830 [Xylaria bambusicola]KAI0520770.1 hypothetical protein F5B22DRAFT_50830 [Xylaria bambusicola]
MKPIRMSWARYFWESEFDGTLCVSIFECDGEVPPTRRADNVKRSGTLCCALDIQFSDLQKTGYKEGLRELAYEIEMVPSGASLEFVLYVDGKKQTGESVEMKF